MLVVLILYLQPFARFRRDIVADIHDVGKRRSLSDTMPNNDFLLFTTKHDVGEATFHVFQTSGASTVRSIRTLLRSTAPLTP
jgi:hypothetical protein